MKRVYAWLLYLFPRAYRLEYREELWEVFSLLLDEARQTGKAKTAWVILKELIGLPQAIIYQYTRARRRMSGKFLSRFDFAPGSRNEFLAGVAPFFMVLGMPSLFGFLSHSTNLSLWVQMTFVLFLGFLVGCLYVIGFARHLPRWFMPYLGLPLPVVTLLTFSILVDPEWHGLDPLYHISWFLGAFVSEGLMWGTLIFLVLLATIMIAFIPALRPVYRRIRKDWTLASFLLYGTAPLALTLTFEEYPNEYPYLFGSFLFLAAGGWLYLHIQSSWKGFWALFFGLALAMAIGALGKWTLFIPIPGYGFTKEREAISTLILWIWLTTIMLLPAILNFFPRTLEHSRALGSGGREG